MYWFSLTRECRARPGMTRTSSLATLSVAACVGLFSLPVDVTVVSSQAIENSRMSADVRIAWLPPAVARWSSVFEQAARDHDESAELLGLIALVESCGDPHARSGRGARGLMQIMPDTARHLRCEIDSPAGNVACAARYLRVSRDALGRDDVTTLGVAYHAGIGTALGMRPADATTRAYAASLARLWAARNAPSAPAACPCCG